MRGMHASCNSCLMACVQGRLTKNVKDLLWLNEWDHKGGSDASAALKDLEVLALTHLFLHDSIKNGLDH